MKLLPFLFRANPTPPAPAANLLNSHQANDLLMQALTVIPDIDLVLEKAQIGRHDLRRLETDDEILSALETRRDAAITTPWRLEPSEGAVPQFVAAALRPWVEPIFRAIWRARPYGYSVIELVYGPFEGKTGLAWAGEKPMQWFVPQRDGTLHYLDPRGSPAIGVPVDQTLKFVLTRAAPTWENPRGEALLSRLYWPWFFRHNAWRFWMQFLERFGEPLLLGQTASPAALVEALQQIGMNSVVAVGQDDKLTAVTSTGTGEFTAAELALTKRIQKLILGQTLTTDTQGVGSQALGTVHNMVRMDKRATDTLMIAGSAQRIVDALVQLNFPGATPPRFEMSDERGLEADRAERDVKLANAGIVRFTEGYLLDRYDFNDGDIIVPDPAAAPTTPAQPGKPAAPGAAPEGGTKKAAGRGRFTADQQAIEDLADDALAQGAAPIPPADIRAAILAATSPEDLEDRLAAVMLNADPAEFRRTLERALFAADLMGYINAPRMK